MSLLRQPATVFYNSIAFADPNLQTLSLDAKPVPDGSGRTVAYILYTITIQTYLSLENLFPLSQDFTMALLRQRLTTPGGEFHYEDQGYGDITINIPPRGPTIGRGQKAAGGEVVKSLSGDSPATTTPIVPLGARDVIWGPKPTLLRWKPLGAQRSAEIIWTVEVAIPECPNAKYDGADNWLEHVYRVTYSIDGSGYTKRTYAGYVRVPQTRLTVDTRTLRYTADDAREKIYPPLLPGYRRTPGDFVISEDRCRLDWSITDQEVGPNYPPEGVIEVQADHSVTTTKSFSTQWLGTISATYELRKGISRGDAVRHFFTLVQDRRGQVVGRLFPVGFVPKNKEGFQPNPDLRQQAIIMQLTLREPEIYGRKCAAFSATYCLAADLKQIVQRSGLWRPVPGNDGSRWVASMEKAWNARGLEGMRYRVKDDFIIDLCLPPKTVTPTLETKPKTVTPVLETKPAPTNKIPPEDESWLMFKAWWRFDERDSVIELKPLPPDGRVPPRPPAPPGGVPPAQFISLLSDEPFAVVAAPGGAGDEGGAAPADPVPVIQRRAAPTHYVWLEGVAMRVGWPIPRPILESVGGRVAQIARTHGCHFEHGIVAEWFGVSVYAASWSTRYILTGPADERMATPANPLAPPPANA